MAPIERQQMTLKGAPAAVWRAGSMRAPLVFIHGGVTGSSPYCSGAHIWGPVLDRFATDRGVLAVDLPGYGGTSSGSSMPTVETFIDWLEALVAACDVQRCFLVGHDLGGLLALTLAERNAQRIAGVAVACSAVAAPTGDSVENLALAYPPAPRWSRHSQRWAFEQLSYAPDHITDVLLDACVDAAQQEPHRAAAAAVQEGSLEDELVPSVAKAKARFYELCRTRGVPVPVQVIWSSHDRLSSLDQGLWLFRLVAARQAAAHFHVINRVGSFPFREDPRSFHQLIDGFCEAVFPRAG
jgi:pimeloyl-ACP methyl ester carboxylesterase